MEEGKKEKIEGGMSEERWKEKTGSQEKNDIQPDSFDGILQGKQRKLKWGRSQSFEGIKEPRGGPSTLLSNTIANVGKRSTHIGNGTGPGLGRSLKLDRSRGEEREDLARSTDLSEASRTRGVGLCV